MADPQSGAIENHTEWNALFANSASGFRDAADINDLAGLGALHVNRRYPGTSDFNVSFANGTTVPGKVTAEYSTSKVDFTKLSSGEALYDGFVVEPSGVASAAPSSILPEPAAPTLAPTVSTLTALPTPWPSNPVVVQPGLLAQPEESGARGVVTGYFLNDSSTAVLSIPSFNQYKHFSVTFSETVAKFIQYAKDAQAKKVVIDLQGNGGGSVILGMDTYRQVRCTAGQCLSRELTRRSSFRRMSSLRLLDTGPTRS